MCLLDHIGACFRPLGEKKEAPNDFHAALMFFSNEKEAEREALYGLRCAFAHDFSLVNPNKRTPTRQHVFKLSPLPDGAVVKLPVESWDGDYEKQIPDSQVTVVDLSAFGDLVERVCCRVKRHAKNDTLSVILSGGHKEQFARFIFEHRR
jgi:hypothetical protein